MGLFLFLKSFFFSVIEEGALLLFIKKQFTRTLMNDFNYNTVYQMKKGSIII